METASLADYYFEGPEKCLEVWFKPNVDVAYTLAEPPMSIGEYPRIGLRQVPLSLWVALLSDVHCTILSSHHDEYQDSYVLSESSMFITPYRFILKTCGQTTLLLALPKLIKYATGVGMHAIQEMFFSRHHLGRPEEQRFPHKTFDDEVRYLDKYFAGSAFSLGRINNNDTCYLYTLDHEEPIVTPMHNADMFTPPATPPQADSETELCDDDSNANSNANANASSDDNSSTTSNDMTAVPDQTLEILMHELDPTAMQAFYKTDAVANFEQATALSGINTLFPDAKLDGHLFEPCGYSVNGMIGPYYFTIHITPQPEFSFASFETNVPMSDYSDLTSRVLSIFRPGRSTLTVMANHTAAWPASVPRSITDYGTQDIQQHHLAQYTIVYARLCRSDQIRQGSPTAVGRSKPLLQSLVEVPA